MLSCSSHGEASYHWLPGVCGQLTHVPVLRSALLQSANTQGLHGAAMSRREGKALVLAPIILLGDGLDVFLVIFLNDQVLQEGVGCSCCPSPHGLQCHIVPGVWKAGGEHPT